MKKKIVALLLAMTMVIPACSGFAAKAADEQTEDVNQFTGVTLELGGKICFNFYVGDTNTLSEEAYVEFKLPKSSKPIEAKAEKGAYGLKFTCLVPAKEMADTISATLYDGGIVIDKKYVSIREYAKIIIENKDNKADYAAAKSLMKAMLEYGEYSQTVFDYEKTSYTWDFEQSSQMTDFDFYSVGADKMTIQDGTMSWSAVTGDYYQDAKAILKRTDLQNVKSVSVDIIPVGNDIFQAGVYIGAGNVENAADQLDSVLFNVLSGYTNQPEVLWLRVDKTSSTSDLTRLDEVQSPNNAAFADLYSDKQKKPLNLRLDFGDEVNGEVVVTFTLSLRDDSSKYFQKSYTLKAEDVTGQIGLRASRKAVKFDNLTITCDTTPQFSGKVAKWDFEQSSQVTDFDFYTSDTDKMTIQNGTMYWTAGTAGNYQVAKAMLKRTDFKNVKSVSVDIVPEGNELFQAGIYIGAGNVGNNSNQLDSVLFHVMSGDANHPEVMWFQKGKTTSLDNGWTDEVTVKSEVAGNEALAALYSDVGSDVKKKPLNLRLDFGDEVNGEVVVTVTLSLRDDSSKYFQKTYILKAEEVTGQIGLRASRKTVKFDNLKVTYDVSFVEGVSEWDFEQSSQMTDFNFYTSNTDNMTIQDGTMSWSAGTAGNYQVAKAMLKRTDFKNVKSVSVDIVPEGNELFQAGIYIGAENVENSAEQLDSVLFNVLSGDASYPEVMWFEEGHTTSSSGWTCEDRVKSTEAGNESLAALYSDVGSDVKKKPLNLRLYFGDEVNGEVVVTVTLSLRDDSSKYFQKSYTLKAEDVTGQIGLRTSRKTVKFDNLSVTYKHLPYVEAVTPDTLLGFVNHNQSLDGFGKLAGSSLILEGETTLRMFFEFDANASLDGLTFTIDGLEQNATRSGKYFVVEIPNISASDLDTNYTVKVAAGDKEFDASCSAMAYCYNALVNTNNKALHNVVKALYLYNVEADAYFSTQQ